MQYIKVFWLVSCPPDTDNVHMGVEQTFIIIVTQENTSHNSRVGFYNIIIHMPSRFRFSRWGSIPTGIPHITVNVAYF